MKNDRPFKTIDEQIDGLISRGLKIENRGHTYDVLLNNNYYSVVNGYKKPFIKKDPHGNFLVPERFLDNCKFSELFALYKYDNELKNLFFKYVIIFESRLKTLVAYRFCEAHRNPYDYLSVENYSQETRDLSNVLTNISNLSKKIDKNKNASYDNSIKHYIVKHENVPLWVLVNFLTFGELQFLFLALDKDLKEKICKDFSKRFKETYNSKEKIDVEEMQMIIKSINLFRNVCAHDEVLYNYCLQKKIKLSLFNKYYVDNSKFKNISKDSKTDIFVLISLLKLVLQNKEFKEFICAIKSIHRKYQGSFKCVPFEELLKMMGFPESWEKRLDINTIA
ncbi:Abi family protein [Enterococcus sp. CSURQ0835]|uniref:Abi family protein n=1 Tax=Enterococcus sp. CSURQ0835 TaxID=2681394 RepID=UPI001358B100|nr:Abi family protein [Enterococcus sp. CSURQ0835]